MAEAINGTLTVVMTIKEQLDQDIKQAMLAGKKDLVTTLRGLKSAILYVEVAESKRDSGLPEDQVIGLLQKEARKRQESADLYRQGKNEEKAAHEETEKSIIEGYLPAQMSEEEVKALVAAEAAMLGDITPQQLGQLIGAVKQASKGTADGAMIARFAKELMTS